MDKYDLSHVSDADLRRELPELAKRERKCKADVLLRLAEVVRRGLKMSPEQTRDMKLFLEDLIEFL